LPVLRLHNIGLPNAGVSDIISGVIDIPVRPANDITTPGLDLGILKVSLTIKPTAQTRIARMHMSGVNASATVGTAELQKVVVPFDITTLTLADLGLETLDVPLIGVS
jgi:hypothetical protein